MQHHHRVEPTADGQKDTVFRTEEIVMVDIVAEAGKHYSKISKVHRSPSLF
jgi:hypothetical protein